MEARNWAKKGSACLPSAGSKGCEKEHGTKRAVATCLLGHLEYTVMESNHLSELMRLVRCHYANGVAWAPVVVTLGASSAFLSDALARNAAARPASSRCGPYAASKLQQAPLFRINGEVFARRTKKVPTGETMR